MKLSTINAGKQVNECEHRPRIPKRATT